LGKWYESAVFYHIYPLGLLGAPARNDFGEVVHRLPALGDWIGHLSALGVTALYIGPLFESSAHGYDTVNWRLVDRRLGDNDDFKDLVGKLHAAGIRVVVDGVFNHTGREHAAFRDIQANRENSPYRDWYKGINFGWNSAYNDGFSYESWRGCGDLVNLNLQNGAVQDELLSVVSFWIDEFDIDGIRLDCADCLDFGFMSHLRQHCDARKQDFWLMGEVIHGDYARWCNDAMLHSVTNYELWKGLWSGHNDHNYFEIAHTIRRQFDAGGGICKGRVLYSFADNHDVTRLRDQLRDPGHLKNVYTLLYTLPGVPSIYYGSEWGIGGRKEQGDAALRPAVDLAAISANPPVPGMEEYLEFLGRVRADHPEIAEGAYRELALTTTQYAFLRESGQKAVAVLLCNDPEKGAEFWLRLPEWAAQITDLSTGETVEKEYDQLHITMNGNGCALYALSAEPRQ